MRETWLIVCVSVSLLGAAPAAALDPEPTPGPAAHDAPAVPEAPAAPDAVELRAELDRLRTRLEGLEAGQAGLPRALHTFELPAHLEFAGEAVPLARWDVAKLILSEPERYGFEVPHEQRYRAYDADVVAIELRDRVAVAELARRAGSFYRELKALNPEIVDDWLGYAIRVPKGQGDAVRAALGGAVRVSGPGR